MFSMFLSLKSSLIIPDFFYKDKHLFAIANILHDFVVNFMRIKISICFRLFFLLYNTGNITHKFHTYEKSHFISDSPSVADSSAGIIKRTFVNSTFASRSFPS